MVPRIGGAALHFHGHHGRHRVEHPPVPAVQKVLPAGPLGGKSLEELSAARQDSEDLEVHLCVAHCPADDAICSGLSP